MALKCAESCRIEGVEFLNMRLIQLNPKVPQKTTNCVGSALNFAVKPGKGRGTPGIYQEICRRTHLFE